MSSAAPRVVWGLGTGRHLKGPAKAGERLLVLAIDVEPGARERVQQVISSRPELADAHAAGRLDVVVAGPTELARRFASVDGAQRDMIVSLPALDAAPRPAQPLARLVERIHLEHRDAQRSRALMTNNLVANARAVAKAHSLAALHNRAQGRPATVLAAGPSAEAFAPLLAGIRQFGPLIAVDTALPLCRRSDVRVDCLVSVDPNPRSEVHLNEGTDAVELLAFQPYCAPAVVETFQPAVVATPAGDAFGDRTAAALDVPAVPVAGTVLVYAMQVAHELGCDPIILVGADFAFVDNRSHARSAATSLKMNNAQIDTERFDGGRVPTSHALERFRHDVERQIAASDRHYWAIDGGGARIAGAARLHRADLPVALSQCVEPQTPNRWIGSLPERSAVEIDARVAIYRELLREFDCA